MPSDKEENFINKICISIRFALILQHLRADTLIHLYELRWQGGDDMVERRLLGALVLTLLELRNFTTVCQKQSQERQLLRCRRSL